MQMYKENYMELNNSLISFGPILNLNKFTDDDIFNGNCIYNLKTTINHIGSFVAFFSFFNLMSSIYIIILIFEFIYFNFYPIF